MKPPEFFLYSRPGCHACVQLQARLTELDIGFHVLDIDHDPELRHRYGARIPVLSLNGRDIFEGRFDSDRLAAALAAVGLSVPA